MEPVFSLADVLVGFALVAAAFFTFESWLIARSERALRDADTESAPEHSSDAL